MTPLTLPTPFELAIWKVEKSRFHIGDHAAWTAISPKDGPLIALAISLDNDLRAIFDRDFRINMYFKLGYGAERQDIIRSHRQI